MAAVFSGSLIDITMKRVVFQLSVFISLLVVSELLLRVFVEFPENLEGEKRTVSTPSPFFVADSILGYRMQPGEYQIVENDTVVWNATHTQDGYRTTGSDLSEPSDEIWIFGCSFTYGVAVADSLTFPFLIQKQFPHLKVRNFGVAGYGTHHALLQLERELDKRRKPATVILAYADFHDMRNTASPLQMKAFKNVSLIKGFTYPRTRLISDSVCIDHVPLAYSGFPLSDRLRLAWLVEASITSYRSRAQESNEVTKALIQRINAVCLGHKIDLVLACIHGGANREQLFEQLGTTGIDVVDISTDLSRSGYYVPGDGHPGQLAHEQYALMLAKRLQ